MKEKLDSLKPTLNEKQKYVADKLEKILIEHSLKLDLMLENLIKKDTDFELYLKSLTDKEFNTLKEHFGIYENGIVQGNGNLLLARFGLDFLEDKYNFNEVPIEHLPKDKNN